ncbi:DUF1543 domain-containing protein [Vallitalea okinawensis]|uniref:DUF1543 domain-containing protein n=1 Tax=Vallitalea okinawensis TaxID=2078660 RepID=UPI000CFD3239|nr:DUF1543 domain-containing protein [Vallitalea okinawensis]
MNLYMISLGGKVKGANIEVHDVQFVVADHIDNTMNLVKEKWYGIQEKLHMDSYALIVGANGYRVKLSKQKSNSSKRLYFVQMGGYNKSLTQEVHSVGFFVAETLEEAKKKALKEVDLFEEEGHVDQVVDIQSCLLSNIEDAHYIELEETGEEFDLRPDWFGYRRLDR